jgi:nitroreductase
MNGHRLAAWKGKFAKQSRASKSTCRISQKAVVFLNKSQNGGTLIMPEILKAMLDRSSVGPRHLTGPAPGCDELLLVAAAAAAAPDHASLGPMRLIHIADATREHLADIFAAAALEADPDADAEAIAKARERALGGPGLLAVVVDLKQHPNVPAEEQWVCAGAALQNTLLALEDLGYRAKMLSGARVRSKALRSAFDLDESAHLLGFIAVGRHQGDVKRAARRAPEQVLSDWIPQRA